MLVGGERGVDPVGDALERLLVLLADRAPDALGPHGVERDGRRDLPAEPAAQVVEPVGEDRRGRRPLPRHERVHLDQALVELAVAHALGDDRDGLAHLLSGRVRHARSSMRALSFPV